MVSNMILDDRGALQWRRCTTFHDELGLWKIPEWVDAQRHVGRSGAWKDWPGGKKSRDAGRSSGPGGMVRIASSDLAWAVDPELDVPYV